MVTCHLLIAYRPNQSVSQMVLWLKGINSRLLLQDFAHPRKRFWGRHLWAPGDFAVTSGTSTDVLIVQYRSEQEGEPVRDDSRFQIGDRPKLPPSRR